MSHSIELRQRLEAGITELEGDIAKLRSAIAALDAASAGGSSSSRSRPRRARRSSAPAPAAREVVPSGKLTSLLSSAGDGLSTSELAHRTNGDPDQVLALLKELEQSGRARRSGTRRSTRWHSAGPAPRSSDAGGSSDSSESGGSWPESPGTGAEPADAEDQIATALDPVVAS
jgi:hypothetical protein